MARCMGGRAWHVAWVGVHGMLHGWACIGRVPSPFVDLEIKSHLHMLCFLSLSHTPSLSLSLFYVSKIRDPRS